MPSASVGPQATESAQEAPPAYKFLFNLRVTVDVPADVLVDGEVVGQAQPTEPFETREIEIGERRIEIRAEGYMAESRTYAFRTDQWVEARFMEERMSGPLPTERALGLDGQERDNVRKWLSLLSLGDEEGSESFTRDTR